MLSTVQGDVLITHPGQSNVCDDNPAIISNQDVCCLEVAMDDGLKGPTMEIGHAVRQSGAVAAPQTHDHT